MEPVRVCRICLAMDVRMQDLQTSPWDTYWKPVFAMNPITAMQLPPYACFECASLLKKNYNFGKKCLLGQSILHNILQTNGMITPELIKKINRRDMKLVSNLQSQIINEDTIINLSYDKYTHAMTEVKIKDEPTEEDTEEGIKMESYYDDFLSGALSSDDDEPLSLHKRNKEKQSKEKKKSKRGRRKTDEDGTGDMKVEIEISDTITAEQTLEEMLTNQSDIESAPGKKKLGRPPKKRGRPRKNPVSDCTVKSEGGAKTKRSRRTDNTGGVADEDVDVEEYVNIIKLTEEEQIEEITKRQFSSNYQNAAFQCNLCFKGFIDTHAWRHHVGKHDPSAGDVECHICKFRFKTKRALQKHAINHEKKYACKSCTYVSKTMTQAKQHQRWHKGVTYKCQHCDEISTKWTSYLSHVRMKHPSEFICGVCGYSFVSKLGLTMHKTMMHKDQPTEDSETKTETTGPYCEECDVKFITVEAYKRHMVMSAKHTNKEENKRGCRVCGESFSSEEELRVHRRTQHARKRPKNYGKKPSNITWPAQCEHCPEMIPNAREYWTHFRRAHPTKSYPIQKDHICDICGKAFRANAFLVYHKRTHFTERAYKCDKCPKAFFNRTNLHMHERTHSDHRPYPCDVCFKAFKCKGALIRHYRSHTGAKPYECEVCGKGFGQSNSRKLHIRTVHFKQPAPYVSRARQERRRTTVQAPPPPAAAPAPGAPPGGYPCAPAGTNPAAAPALCIQVTHTPTQHSFVLP